MNLAIPPNIRLVQETVTKQWMQAQTVAFEQKYGFKISSFGTDDWLPTPHGITMAEAIAGPLNGFFTDKKVLELGSGVGNHTVLIMDQRPKQLTVTEITAPRLDVTRKTLRGNDLDDSSVDYVVGDWLHLPSLKGRKFDVVITNPPFSASGRRNRRYFIDELVLNSWRYLEDGGYLVLIHSSMALLEQTAFRMRQNGYLDVRVVHAVSYFWRDYYFDDATFLQEVDDNKKRGYCPYSEDDGLGHDGKKRRIETLYVVMGRLKPWSGTAIQH